MNLNGLTFFDNNSLYIVNNIFVNPIVNSIVNQITLFYNIRVFNKEKKWGHRTWSISVYNAYNRKNPFFLNFDQIRGVSGSSETVLKQYSLFPIIPSLSYSFKIK